MFGEICLNNSPSFYISKLLLPAFKISIQKTPRRMINDEKNTAVELFTFLIKFRNESLKTKLQNNFRRRKIYVCVKKSFMLKAELNFPPRNKEIVTLKNKIRNWSSEIIQRKLKWVGGAHVDAVMILFMTQFPSLRSIKKVLADGKFDSFFLFLFPFSVVDSVMLFFYVNDFRVIPANNRSRINSELCWRKIITSQRTFDNNRKICWIILVS